MRVEHNCDLSQFTTLHIGGRCKTMYYPTNTQELLQILNEYPDAKLLGGGSNLLINDEAVFDCVICLRDFLKDMIEISDNSVTVGAGVRLQKLISEINANGLGGIEYLFSVPGLVGGALLMNAGRGRGANKQISDYLISVDVLENGQVHTYTKEQCGFGYRTSVFKNKNCVILKAVFAFDRIEPKEGKRLQHERIEICKKFQDARYPNAGTTFCQADPRIMQWTKKLASKKKKTGVHFSDKSANWLQNRGNGTFKQATRLLKTVENVHKLFGKKCSLECIIWE